MIQAAVQIPRTPKLPAWPVYDYENLFSQIEVWHKIIDCHGGDAPNKYIFSRDKDHLIISKKMYMKCFKLTFYSQLEFPLSVGQWFVDSIENKFWKPKSKGGLGPWKGLVEYLDGEELGVGRAMAMGGPGIGGYQIDNFSRTGHPLEEGDTRPESMSLYLHDILLQDVGMYGFFLDLKKWYEAEQATGIKKPLYPKIINIGQIDVDVLPAKAILIKAMPSLDKKNVMDYWISWGDYLFIVSKGENYFNQVEIPKQALPWIADTVEKLFFKNDGKNQVSPMEYFAPSIVIGDTEQIRVTNGLGQVSLAGTRFRLMNLNRTSYTDPLMAQEFDLYYAHFEKHGLGQLFRMV